MATKTVVNVMADAATAGVGPLILSEAERLLVQRPTARFLAAPWLNSIEAGGIADTLSGAYAAPIVSGIRPSRHETGGPDGAPWYQALAADPVGGLMTNTGVVNAGGDWTLAVVGKASTNLGGVLLGIGGAAGGAHGICLRSDDKMVFKRYTATGPTGLDLAIISGITTADWHLVVVSYKPSATTFTIWIDGVEVHHVTNQSITPGTSKLTLFSTYDPSASPALSADADEGGIAAAWCFAEYAGDNSDALLDLIQTAALDRFPTLY